MHNRSLSNAFLAGAALLTLCATPSARAQHLDLAPVADGFTTRTDPMGMFTTLNSTLAFIRTENRTNAFGGSPDFNESRGIFEFDISALPMNATITGVNFHVYESGTGRTFADGPRPLFFYGYAGDGMLGTGDATSGSLMSILSGGFDNTTLFQQDVQFDPSSLQGVLGTSSFFGLDTRMDEGFFNHILLTSSRNTDPFLTTPVLSIDYRPGSGPRPRPRLSRPPRRPGCLQSLCGPQTETTQVGQP